MMETTTPKSSRAKRRIPHQDSLDKEWTSGLSEDGNGSPSSRIPWNFGKPVIDKSRMNDVKEVRKRLQSVKQAQKTAKKRHYCGFLTNRSPSVSPIISRPPEKVKRVIDPRKLIDYHESFKLSCENLDKAIEASKAAHRPKRKLDESNSPADTFQTNLKASPSSITDDNDNELTVTNGLVGVGGEWDDSFDPTVVDAVLEVEKKYYSTQATAKTQESSCTEPLGKLNSDVPELFMNDDDDYIFLAESLQQY